MKYRNESLDAVMEELIFLRKELAAIGNNFNQAMHKLHTLQQIPEFRNWLLMNEGTKQQIAKKTSEIQQCIDSNFRDIVARIRSGKSIKGAVNYNEQKVAKGMAKLLIAEGCPKDPEKLKVIDKITTLQKLVDPNTIATTHCVHLSQNW